MNENTSKWTETRNNPRQQPGMAPALEDQRNAQNQGAQNQETQNWGAAQAENHIAYQAATPYPPIRVSECNPQYAAAMLDNMAGQVSEMSAVGLYFYDNLLTTDLKEVTDAFHQISLIEMHHLDIFARLAMQLGENPRLWAHMGHSGRYVYWSPANLRYPPIHPPEGGCTLPPASLRLILSQAIEEEQRALSKYMKQTSWILDRNICDSLIRIAADEQMHLEILTRLYHSV